MAQTSYYISCIITIISVKEQQDKAFYYWSVRDSWGFERLVITVVSLLLIFVASCEAVVSAFMKVPNKRIKQSNVIK